MFWILSWDRPCLAFFSISCFCGFFRGGQTLSVRFFRNQDMFGFFCGPDLVCPLFLFFGGCAWFGGGCYILLWIIVFRGQSPVAEANFCRNGKPILSTGIVGLDFGIWLLDSSVGQTLSFRYFLDLKHYWILSLARPCLFIFWFRSMLDSFVGPDLVC